MIKIEMLDHDGVVIETVERVHVCKGNGEDCQDPARCEGCGDQADPHTRVYVWTSANGVDYFCCSGCIQFERIARVVGQE